MNKFVKIPGLWMPGSNGVIKIYPEKILYCHHNNDITRIVYTNGQDKKVNVSLKKMESRFCKKRFYRCHRNYLINLDHAGDLLHKNFKPGLPKNCTIPVSRRRRNKLMVLLEGTNSGQDLSD